MNKNEVYVDSSLEARFDQMERKLDLISLSANAYGRNFHAGGMDDEIDLRKLWIAVWNGKWIVIIATFIFSVASAVYAISLPNVYRSEALLAPVEENSGGGLAGLAGQFGSLASLAGVNLGRSGGEKITLAIEVLKSRDFLFDFIEKYKLLVPIVAAEGWDKKNNALIIDKRLYDVANQFWIRKPKANRGVIPTRQEAYRKFIKTLSLTRDKKTNFVSLSIEHYSPILAKEWVDLLIYEINQEMKQMDVYEAKRSINFLVEELGKTSVADMRSIFYELIEEQTKVVMFAQVRDEYVFKTIDQAIVPERKVGPRRSLFLIGGTIFGLFFAVLVIFVRHYVK